MILQNGYKKIYEHAANGERTLYATVNDVCDPAVDTKLGSFVEAEFAGRMLYEYHGKVYAAVANVPAYDENGVPTDDCVLDLTNIGAASTSEANEPAPAAVEPEDEEHETTVEPDEDETDETDEPEDTEDPEEVTED